MDKGYISVWRTIFDNPIWLEDKFSRGQAWIDLLLLANHKQGFIRKRGIRIEINRGEVGRSKETLSERWQWSRNKVSKFLSELEQDGMITIENKESKVLQKINIINYDKFQQTEQQNFNAATHKNGDFSEEMNNKLNNKLNNKRTSERHQKDTNNNNNNSNNENNGNKEEKTIVLSDVTVIDFNSYMNFWNHYADQLGLAKIKLVSESRKRKIKARLNSDKEFERNFAQAVRDIGESDFLKGLSNDWKVNFDWLIENDKNYMKVIEGNYNGSKLNNQQQRNDAISSRMQELYRKAGYK